MASSFVSKVFLISIVIASLVAMSGEAKTIVVGGSEGWRYGVNYTDWAIQNSPFYINDKLVFKYEPPSDDHDLKYNVYLLPNLASFIACDFSKAHLLANATQGSGNGFEVELSQWRPYYLASYNHCKDGLMRVLAVPWPHLG